MNLALRKLVLLEKTLQEKEMAAKLEGYTTCPVDTEFRRRVGELMEKVNVL